MWELCLGQLAEITDGRLRLGSLPPLAGDLEPVRRIVLEPDDVDPGDVYWDLRTMQDGTGGPFEQVFARGGLGIVTGRRAVEPWAGKFVLEVDDVKAKLVKLLGCCPPAARQSTFVFGKASMPRRRSRRVTWEEITSNMARGICAADN